MVEANAPPPPPDFESLDTDDESIPPPPPPLTPLPPAKTDNNHDDTFQDNAETNPLTPNKQDDDTNLGPTRKWRILKKEAEHVLLPQVELNPADEKYHDGNSNMDEIPYPNPNPNSNVPIQGHFRGIHNAQIFDEEEAGMDEIEVPSSSVVARLNSQLERKARKSVYVRTACILFALVCVLVGVIVGSVVGVNRNQNDVSASIAVPEVTPELPVPDTPELPVGYYTPAVLNESVPGKYLLETAPQNTIDAFQNKESPQYSALQWITDDDANADFGFNDNGAFADDATKMNFEQRFAAATFLFTLGGNDWLSDENWMTDKNVCEWEGIVCEENIAGGGLERKRKLSNIDAAAVTSIDMSARNLVGVLPPEIAMFSQLKVLVLVSNWIQGPIPDELFLLTNLETIDLYDNVITGEISSDFPKLQSLRELYLGFNQMEGGIPEGLSQLKNLESIWLNGNNFSGQLPTSLATIPSLKDIEVEQNSFFGPIPTEYGNIPTLQRLSLGYNDITGGIPVSFEDSNVSAMYLDGNIGLFVDGLNDGANDNSPFPGIVLNMPSLEIVSLKNCGMTGDLPDFDLDTQLLNLKELLIDGNFLSGEIPLNYGGVAPLEVFSMSDNNFTGELPWSFQDLNNLRVLDMSQNILEGAIPKRWAGGMESIEELVLSGNWLTGNLPELQNWDNIRILMLDQNIFTGDIPKWIKDVTSLEEMHLQWNAFEDSPGFTGVIPNMASLVGLRILNLQGNDFSGEIPINLPLSLTELRLNDNELVGEIPQSIELMENLEMFTFENNYIDFMPTKVCELGIPTLIGGCQFDCPCCTDLCEIGV